MIKTYRYEQSLAEVYVSKNPIVFLAGPTVRGNQPHLESWRPAAIEAFEQNELRKFHSLALNIIIPEFTEKTESDKGKLWIPAWEFAGLCMADVIMFWIPRTKELIGLTTNHEHGFWLGYDPNKIVYGRPDDSYRNGYIDLMNEYAAIQNGHRFEPPATTLEETVNRSVEMALEARENSAMQFVRRRSKVHVASPYGSFDV
jgi:hypothetical protein